MSHAYNLAAAPTA